MATDHRILSEAERLSLDFMFAEDTDRTGWTPVMFKASGRMALAHIAAREAEIAALREENERLKVLAVDAEREMSRASTAYLAVQRGFERLQMEMDGVQGILVAEGSRQYMGRYANPSPAPQEGRG